MASFDVIYNCNMIHLGPPTVMQGLCRVAGKLLTSGGMLIVYGPFKIDGQCAESNATFDTALKSRDPTWGLRDLTDLDKLLAVEGLVGVSRIEMPANNLLCVWRKN
mmetsp:Transcript_8638/g.20377  ORF Transcript_8638/g.20377 Transcript_8638/m.20377 type:complete len:106 (+) Transcript_8638:404-721(+)